MRENCLEQPALVSYSPVDFYRTLVRLALPIALQNLIAFTVNFADNVMIGRLGDLAISGVFIGNQIHSMVQFIVTGVGSSLVILATQYWGKKDLQSIRSITVICLWTTFGIGMIFTLACSLFPAAIAGLMSNNGDVINSAVPYLRIVGLSFVFFTLSQVLVASQRSVEKVHFGMNIALLTLGLNIALNYCLIFGKLGFPALGVAGAAIATLISRIVEFGIAVVYIFRFDICIGLKLADLLKLDGFFGKSLLNYGAPTVGSDTVWAINSFAYTAIIGRFTPDVIASFNIAGMMNTLVYIWLSGFAAAMGIMTGKLVGAGTGLQEIKRYTYRVQRFLIGLAFFTGLFVFLTRGPLIFMYKVSPGATATAFLLMNVLSLTIMGTAYQMPCLIGLVKGGGSTSFGFKNDCVFVFLIVIPASIIAMSLKAPAPVVFLCLKSDQFLKCLVAVVVINRFRWIKNLTRDHDEVFK